MDRMMWGGPKKKVSSEKSPRQRETSDFYILSWGGWESSHGMV